MTTTSADRTAISQSFIEQVSSIGRELFVEIFTDATKKRQGNLLAWSVLTILLSLSYVTTEEGSLFGLKLKKTDLMPLTIIVTCVCTYFIIVFLLSVIRDLTANGYRFISLTPKIDRTIASLRKEQEDEKVKLLQAVNPGLHIEMLQGEEKKKDKYTPQIEELTKKLQAIVDDQNKDYGTIILELNSLTKQLDSLKREMNKNIADYRETFLKQAQEGTNAVIANFNSASNKIKRRYNAVTTLLNWYATVFVLILVTEIIFPFGLGVYAILLGFGLI